jgi:uncharacterized protein (TIRG00374 family)
MRRRVQIALFVGGCAVVVWLVHRIGLSVLAADVTRIGWRLLPIVLVYAGVYALYAWAWHLTMEGAGPKPSYLRTWSMSISGFALNYVTPLVNLGGEPFKIAALAPWFGTGRATGTVMIYWMIHALSNLIVWLAGLALALRLAAGSTANVGRLLVVAVPVLGIGAVLLLILRRGVLERVLDALQRAPLLGRLAKRLEPRRAALIAMDEQIVRFSARNRRRFVLALLADVAGRCLACVEFQLIFAGLGLPAGYGRAFLVGSFSTLILNIVFFVPLEAGTREGGLYLIARALGLTADVGVFAAIVNRVRELVWIAIGLLLIWAAGRRRASPRPPDRQRAQV